MTSGDGLRPGAAARDEQVAELQDRLAVADEERAEMRRAITDLTRTASTLTEALNLILPAAPPPGQPVPQNLAEALDGPRSPAPAQVPVRAHGRPVDVWVTGGSGVSPAEAWRSVLGAVPEKADGGVARLVRVPLADGLAAIVDGPRFTVAANTSSEGRKALRAAMKRQARTAGVAVPGAAGAWGGLRAAPHLRLAASAVRSHIPRAAIAAGSVAAVTGIALCIHPLTHGSLPHGASLAPAVTGASPQAGSRARHMSFTVPGGGAGLGYSTASAGSGNPGTAGSYPPPASTVPGIPVTTGPWPGSLSPIGITTPPVPPLVPILGHQGAGGVVSRTVHRIVRRVNRTPGGVTGLAGSVGHKLGLDGLGGL